MEQLNWTMKNTFFEIVVPEIVEPEEMNDKTIHVRSPMRRSNSDSSIGYPGSPVHRQTPAVFPWHFKGAPTPELGEETGSPSQIKHAPEIVAVPERQFSHARVNTFNSTCSTKTPCSEDGTPASKDRPADLDWIALSGSRTPRTVWGDDPPIEHITGSSKSERMQEKLSRKQIIFPRSYGEDLHRSSNSEQRNSTNGLQQQEIKAKDNPQASDSADPNLLCEPCDFDMVEALEFYQGLVESQEKGVDIRQSLEHADLDKYLPLDDQGQQMSLGSIPHLCHPIGRECKPCSAYPRGKCYRGNSCMHCHFYHPLKERNRPDVMKKRRARCRPEQQQLGELSEQNVISEKNEKQRIQLQ
jgi:hypothetical protein